MKLGGRREGGAEWGAPTESPLLPPPPFLVHNWTELCATDCGGTVL